MTAVPLALILVATLAVLVAVTPGAFSFDRWPEAPTSATSEREVVVDVSVAPTDEARADARREPAVERDGAAVVVDAPEPERPGRPAAPETAPSAPRAVAHADTRPDRVPEADGDGATVRTEPAPQQPAPTPVELPEAPLLPALPAKQIPGEQPDHRVPEWDGDRARLPRKLRDDQE